MRVLFFSIVLTFASSFIQTTHAEWKIEITDRFIAPNKLRTGPTSINFGSPGKIFVSGWNVADPQFPYKSNGILRFSSDQGKSWKTAKIFPDYLLVRSVALKNNNILLYGNIGGNLGEKIDDFKVESRILTPQGKMHVVDRYRLHPNGPSLANDVAITQKGEIYLSASAKDESESHANGLWHWTIRKSTDDGRSWKTIDDFECAKDPDSCVPNGFVEDANSNVFVTGWWAAPEKTKHSFTTRKLSPNSSTWILSDLYSNNPNKYSAGRDIFSDDARKTIYTVGYSEGIKPECVVRKSSNFGKTWETLLKFKHPKFMTCDLHTGDRKESLIVVAGEAVTQKKPRKSTGIIKMSEDGGKTWSPTLFVQGEDKSDFMFRDLLVLNSKEVLLLGTYEGIDPMKHKSDWFVYRLYKK